VHIHGATRGGVNEIVVDLEDSTIADDSLLDGTGWQLFAGLVLFVPVAHVAGEAVFYTGEHRAQPMSQ
jgi:hypothetical protein